MIVAQLLLFIALCALIWLIVVAFKRSALWGLAVLFLSPITATIYACKYWDESKKPYGVYASTFLAGLVTFAYVFSSWGGVDVIDAAMGLDQGDSHTVNDDAVYDFAHATLNFIEQADDSQAQDVALIRDFVGAMEAGDPDAAACGLYRESLNSEQPAETRAMIQRNMKEMGCMEPQNQQAAQSAEPTRTIHSLLQQQRPVFYEQVYKPIEVVSAVDHVGQQVLVTRNSGVKKECQLVGVHAGKLTFEQRVGSGIMTFSYNDHDISALEALTDVPI